MLLEKINAVQYLEGVPRTSSEVLTREEALQIRINGKSYTLTMRTPGNDVILVAGLLLSEGIIREPDDILEMHEIPTDAGDSISSVEVILKENVHINQSIFNRSIASSASCGVCGKADVSELVIPTRFKATHKKLRIDLIPKMLDSMRKLQLTFEETGGSHAAALLTTDGEVLTVHEDIGRHNAVDKVIGELLLSRILHSADILLVSGRVSYEIVAKCAQAKISFLLAVSAPSSLAVEFCKSAGITLVGFCRESRATVYTHLQNVQNNHE